MNNNKKGFTLLELLVVAIILGILAAVALPRLASVVERSRGTEATNFMREVRSALSSYSSAYGSYTDNFDALGFENGSGVTLGSDNTVAILKYWNITVNSNTGLITAVRTSGGDAVNGQNITLDINGTWGGNYKYRPTE